MKILVLTGRFGMGHIKCAETLREMILRRSPDAQVEIVDLIEYLYPHAQKAVYAAFGELVSNYSGLYNRLNLIAGKRESTPFKGICTAKIAKLVERIAPDLVVANLPICAQYFSYYKEMTDCKTPLFVFVTDITFHPEWIARNASLYFVGDDSTKNALISHGVSAEKIHVTGIPVSDQFSKPHMPRSRKNILVMGGGLGLVPGGLKTLDVLDQTEDADVTLICGNNRKLQTYAMQNCSNIRVLGFTDHIPELMLESDILVTKPGGITLFEAISSATPIFVIAPNLQQEIGNARFIEKNRIGRIFYDRNDFSTAQLQATLKNEDLLAQMQMNMRKLMKNAESANPLDYFERGRSA